MFLLVRNLLSTITAYNNAKVKALVVDIELEDIFGEATLLEKMVLAVKMCIRDSVYILMGWQEDGNERSIKTVSKFLAELLGQQPDACLLYTSRCV